MEGGNGRRSTRGIRGESTGIEKMSERRAGIKMSRRVSINIPGLFLSEKSPLTP